MRAYRRLSYSPSSGPEWVLLVKGLLKLLVVGTLILTFREMAQRSSSEEAAATTAEMTSAAQVAPARQAERPGSTPPGSTPPGAGPSTSQTAPTPPPEDDPDEAEAIHEELQAVSDGEVENGPEEMKAYNRLIRWAVSQPLASLQQRARKDVVFADFMHAPDKHRGKLFSLKLNVVRILDVGRNRDGTQLYEVCGWTTESKAWLYWGVVVDLPPGMPIGPSVQEKATLVGYFFKLQGYHEAGAKPHDKPLKTPLFIGRLAWHPTKPVKIGTNDWYWAMLAGIGLLVIMVVQFGVGLFRKKRPAIRPRSAAALPSESAVPIEDWLRQAEQERDKE